jgi:phosphate transport system permease protein
VDGGSSNAVDDRERLSILEASVDRGRRARDGLATTWLVGSFIVVAIPLVLIVGYVVMQGISAISWEFLTAPIEPSRRREGGGIGPAILGTVLITLGATAMAVPLGVLGAIYLHEYGGKGRVASVIRFMSDVMTGVPSVVMGLFVYTIWVLAFGQSGFAGSIALACLMLPVIIRSTEEMLRLVPDELRQGAYALGARKSRAIATVVLPTAIGGITSGIMLAVARAAGETAPLLFTVGIVYDSNWNLFEGPNVALPQLIFQNAQQPYDAAQAKAWGAALTLVVIVLVFTVAARLISSRFSIKHR